MVKVCHITTIHSPFDTRIFHKEVKTLVKTGYEVSLIAPKADNNQMTKVVDGVKIIFLPKSRNRFFRILCSTRKAHTIAFKEKADIYHFHDPEFLPWAIKLKKGTGAKVIYDVHEDIPQQIISKEWIPQFFRGTVSKTFDIYEKSRVRNLDFVIAAWPKIKEKFQKAGITNVETITNYPTLEYFKQTTYNNQLTTNGREIKLIYTGGLTRIRGIKEIIKSLNYFTDKKVKLILIGKFQEEGLEEELKRTLEWDKVEFKGWLNHRLVCKELMNANIGLICLLPTPNHINSFPNKLFEYMAAGLPVVASNFPLWKGIIREENCGLTVNPQEPREIAKAINYLIEHPTESRKMGENGRKSVLEKYNWEKESQKLIKIYQQLTTKY